MACGDATATPDPADLDPRPDRAPRATAAPDDASPGRPSRSGEPWTASEDDELVAGLRAGLTVDALAEQHRRTTGAVRSRLTKKIPDPDDETLPRSGKRRVEWLRQRLAAEPAYDWRSVLDAALGPRQRQWTDAELALVRDAWERRVPLADLAASVGAEEHYAVRLLVQLGSPPASSTRPTASAAPPAPSPPGRLALDAASTRVLVLVVAADGETHHVSVHATDADTVCDRAVARLRDTNRRIEIALTVAAARSTTASCPGGRPGPDGSSSRAIQADRGPAPPRAASSARPARVPTV